MLFDKLVRYTERVSTNDPLTLQIAARVREARKAAHLSQEELGSKMGLTKVGYGEYERGRRLFDTDQLFRLERVLGVSVAWLLGLPTELTPEEDRVITLYRQASIAGRRMVMSFLTSLTEEEPE